MLMVISPAKTLDFDTPPVTQRFTQPQYLDHSQELIEQLRELSPAQISELMHVSDKIGGLNAARFGSWTPAFTQANAKQALLAFKGDVYTGLNAQTFKDADFTYAQEHLRMLSGLYGLLRPLDLMMPYRLEMGTKLANARGKDLYAFWATRISEWLNEAQPGIQRVLLGGQAPGAERADHQHRVQGPEKRPVQDHQLLRQKGPGHDEPLCHRRTHQRSGPAQAV